MADNEAAQGAGRAQAAALALGERLRSARKARALTVAQVAQALHLEEPIVVALEEEQFDSLGAPVFVRGHLRRYAQLVGLPEEVVLEAYRNLVPDSDRLPSLARRREQAEGMRLGPWVYWLAGALVLVGIIVSLATGGGEGPAAPADESAPVVSP